MKQTASRGPGRPPAAKAAETRERIVRAAREVFSELGYDAATFQAIAIRADLTRPAINHYFKSKRLLYREVVERTNEMVVIAGAKKAFESDSLIGQLHGFIDAAMVVDAEDRSAAAFLVTAILEAQRHPELRQDQHDSLKNTREFLAWAINGAIERGELTTETAIEPLVEMLVAMMWGMGFYAGFVGSHDDLNSITDNFARLMTGKLWKLRE
ncbi:MAG: TetR/AcrR family transcriptional regulator [Mycobacteriaceae bacterium]|nr:TetR/AcrR family transcriptional regulator [Mycobacteriaceae bacterium]